MDVLGFISLIKEDVEQNGYTLELIDKRYIDTGDNAPSSGYFCDENKKIVVCIKSFSMIEILAHEYSHFRQTIENKILWEHGALSYNEVFSWLDGNNCKDIDRYLQGCLDLELDCEKRAYKLLKKHKFDVTDYIAKANAYMYFWKYLKYTRRWCHPFNSPSTNTNILMAMPNKFQNEYILTKEIKKVYKQEYI